MSNGKDPIFGLNFSQKYATDLEMDWRTTYIAIIDELQPKRMRISAHWNLIEKKVGEYNFSDLDWQIKEAQKRNIDIILAIGLRTPRWPECHFPKWAKNMDYDEQKKYILKLLEKEVLHFSKYDNIKYWQVENEPLLGMFGECPDGDEEFLDEEINLVRSLSDKPIILTESGELSTWRKLSKKTDVLGTSMYRTVWNPYWGSISYPLPVYSYYYKAKINKSLNKNLKKVIITELQGEAWTNRELQDVPIKDQYKSMNLEKFKNIINYSKRSGLDEIYIWGAEWWYWLKENEDDSFWNTAKSVL